ncbi:MAG: hypothetical protein MPW14_13925 [Candidatus Manganitrophus sp.]|nr:MAG: hypothetical protein MPW14_13925 [Candidatus Manganitrophus sp.]
MAGIYTRVDNASRGVWKAPDNVSLNAVISPSVDITDEEQEALNVSPPRGSRSTSSVPSSAKGCWCRGRGPSTGTPRLALNPRAADDDHAGRVDPAGSESACLRAQQRQHLGHPQKHDPQFPQLGIWKRGGLSGATPDDAFSVQVGLGETMTAEEILEGILRVTVQVAICRPAEFVEITFRQRMQTS